MNLTIPDVFYWDEIDEVLDGFGPRFCTICLLCGSTLVTQKVLEMENKLG